MATPLFYDSVSCTTKVLESNLEHSVETEILLADYDAPVFKIIKTTMEHSVSQKYVLQNKLTVEGFIKICIFYQPPAGEKLSVVSRKIPFQKQIELTDTPEGDCFICVSGQSQYVNTRAQNSTRIDVRGAYLFNFKVYGTKNTKVITAIKAKNICTDDNVLEYFSLTGQNIRQFNIEDELEIGENGVKILRVETHSENVEINAFKDKVTVKGDLCADIFYSHEEDYDVKKYSRKFPFNQIIDISGLKENHIPYAQIEVGTFTISQNQDTKKLVANATVQIDVRAFGKQEAVTVCDAFSKTLEYEAEKESILIDSNIYAVDKAFGAIIADKFSKDFAVSDVVFEIGQPRIYFEINKTTVKAKVTAHVIARNVQNEYECFTKTEDIVLDWLEKCAEYDEIVLNLAVTGYSIARNEDELKINADISACGFVMEKKKAELLHSFNETEQLKEKPAEALIIYYANKGEYVFDIAKAHSASPQLIAQENDIAEKQLAENKMLFIPAFED